MKLKTEVQTYFKPAKGPFTLIEQLVERAIDEGPEEKVKNRGDVAEGILGAAVAARFVKGEASISTDDVANILATFDKQKPTYYGRGGDEKKSMGKEKDWQVKRKDGTVDVVQLDIRLASVNFLDLMNLKKRGYLQDLFAAAAKYANSEAVVSESMKAAMDGVSSKILILSDGIGDQKGTKVDVRVFKDGKELSIGKISLKAGGTKQMGQIGKSWKAAQKGSRGIFDLFEGLFGVQLSGEMEEIYKKAIMSKSKPEMIKAVSYVYDHAVRQMAQMYNKDDPKEVGDFLRRLARGVRYEAVLEEEDVILVHLDAGDFKALDFSTIEDKFAKIGADLEVKYEPPKKLNFEKNVPYIRIYNKGERLVSIRPKIRDGGEFRHYVEKERGLVKLLKLANKTSGALKEDTLQPQVLDLGAKRRGELDESWLRMFGGAVKGILSRMFDGKTSPFSENNESSFSIKGTKSEIDKFSKALQGEKEYMLAYQKFGLESPAVVKSKYQLQQTIDDFTQETGIKWPIK
ncbi:MAG TPA: hypothetical protein VMW25_05500 [Clostridia bacterium]|nr:hypothetical protein [Clostridia bacterium]